jgi:hypothetical protein
MPATNAAPDPIMIKELIFRAIDLLRGSAWGVQAGSKTPGEAVSFRPSRTASPRSQPMTALIRSSGGIASKFEAEKVRQSSN